MSLKKLKQLPDGEKTLVQGQNKQSFFREESNNNIE